MSRMTSILEVDRSLDSCTLAVHRPLAYFRSANLKTFCKYAKSMIKDANCFVKKWEMAAATTNQRLKGTCIAWVHEYDITFPVQLCCICEAQLAGGVERKGECGPFFAAVAPYLPTFRPPLPRPRAFAEAPPLFAGGVCRGGARRSRRCGGVRRALNIYLGSIHK